MANFALDVKKFAESFEDGAEQAIRGTSIKLFSAIIQSSPVDTGRFRGNWFTTGQQPSVKVNYSITDKDGSKSKKEVVNVVSKLKDYSTFTMTNNLPYAQRLEMGYSEQSPVGMVRVNVLRFNSLLEVEARKELPK